MGNAKQRDTYQPYRSEFPAIDLSGNLKRSVAINFIALGVETYFQPPYLPKS
jgi:hypothetical protein